MTRELERIDIPGEHEARERTWRVVQAAFSEREAARPERHLVRPALAVIAVAVVAGVIASPPGRAVIDRVRRVVGVESAKPALFSLPAPGRLLVSSDAGVWIVQRDGSKRLLGDYREASWSPFGRFVIATRENELAALEPNGDVRWTLARPGVESPSWGGTRTDTRIAYADDSGIRVVAGDGTEDRLLVARGKGPLAWRPGGAHVLAYVDSRRRVVARETDSGHELWRATLPPGRVTGLSWSKNGGRLLVQSPRYVRVYEAEGRLVYELAPGAAPVTAASLGPTRYPLAFVQTARGRSHLWVVPRLRPDASAARRLLAGAGSFEGLAWSPDGRWLLVTWPAANQWAFVRSNGRGIRAASAISEQFRSISPPRVEGWVP